MGICSATSHLSKYTPFIAFAAITKLTFVISPGSYPACAKVYFANVPKRLTGRRSGDRSVPGAQLRVESHTCAGTADQDTSPLCCMTVSSLLESSTLKRVKKADGSWLLAGPGTKSTGSHFQISEAARIPFSHSFAQLPRCKHLFIWSNRSPSCVEVKVVNSWIRPEQSVATHLPLGKLWTGSHSCAAAAKAKKSPICRTTV
jgi:hypothetical protein